MGPCKHCGKYLCDCEKWSEHVKQATQGSPEHTHTPAANHGCCSCGGWKCDVDVTKFKMAGIWAECRRQHAEHVKQATQSAAPRPVVNEEAAMNPCGHDMVVLCQNEGWFCMDCRKIVDHDCGYKETRYRYGIAGFRVASEIGHKYAMKYADGRK